MEEEGCTLTIQEMELGLSYLETSRENARKEVSDLTKRIIEMRKQIHARKLDEIKHLLPAQCQAYTRYVTSRVENGKQIFIQRTCPFSAYQDVNGKKYCMRHADKVRRGVSFREGTQEELGAAWAKNKRFNPSTSAPKDRTQVS